MFEWRWLALLGALLAAGVFALGALRSGRELRAWLGSDPWCVRRALRAGLFVAALALLGALLLQRSTPGADGGPDVVLALDVSRSMAAVDAAPSRLRRALQLAERLLLEPAAGRFGLVFFAGDAFAALPLSADREVLIAYLRAVDTELASASGTDLGRALGAARELFEPAAPGTPAPPRAVLLFSDGEHDPGRDPAGLAAAAGALRERGARVIAVAFGTAQGGLLPATAGEASPPRSRRRTELLHELAQGSGGALYRELEDRPSAAELLRAAAGAPNPLPARGRLALLIALAFAALAAEWLLAADWARAPGRERSGRGAAPALTLLALLLLGAAPPEALRAGDRLLAAGDARGALTHFERIELREGPSAQTRLRIGNALYRLGELQRAAAAYLDALRAEPVVSSAELRHAAQFNLGTALLAQGELEAARAALWTALRERPGDLAAQWNYELALERLAAEPPSEGPSEPAPPDAPPDPDPASGAAGGAGSEPRSSGGAQLGEAEAERWLASVEDALPRALRQQLREALEPPRPAPQQGQTW